MDLAKLLQEARGEEEKLTWEGSFAEYLEMVIKNPAIARLSHARIYTSILAGGVETGRLGEQKYKLFSGEIFGLEKALRQLVEYYASAARRLEVRKRILVLLGPVGSGKSTIVNLLKRGLEDYTRTDEGAIYAIKGCPMQEEPLHLIPMKLRPAIEKEYGIYIEGELCPRCRYALLHDYRGDVQKVRVQRIVLSEKDGIGIGTFIATDPGSQDLSRLVGSIDQSLIGEDRLESAGRAYRLDGELNVANRGLMEFIELLKSDEKFLTALLILTQEQKIKTGRFGMIYADEAVIAHTNEAEYEAFVANKKAEALQDRVIIAPIPYNLKVSDEVKIYEKMLEESTLADIHFAPLTLKVASTFAVLSRFQSSKKRGMTLMKKLKLYDGGFVEDFDQRDVEEMQEETPREGMTGISPRYVINRLSNTVAKGRVTCIDPITGLQALWDGIEQSTTLAREEQERLLSLFTETRREYDEIAKKEIQKAMVYSFEDSVKALLDGYMMNAEAFCSHQKIRDPSSGEEQDPDERLMRSLERPLGIDTDNERKAFREDIRQRFSSLASQGRVFDYATDYRLKEAIEKRLFPPLREVARITALGNALDTERASKRNEVIDRLIRERGYCPQCASGVLDYVGRLLQAGERARVAPKGRLRWLWG